MPFQTASFLLAKIPFYQVDYGLWPVRDSTMNFSQYS